MSYLGEDVLISYLKEQENQSYLRFLTLHRDVIVASLRSSDKWDSLDNIWVHHFLKEAEELLDQKIFVALKKKVKSERSRYVNMLKRYWKGIVAEQKKGPGKKGKGKENINAEGTSTQPLNERVLRKTNPVNYAEADFSDVDSHVDDVEKRVSAKARSFSSYKTVVELKEVLRQYKVDDGDIMSIEQFNPIFEEIDDDDKALNRCMENIEEILMNIKTMSDANEYTRCAFISHILHASITITRRVTNKEIFIALQKDVSGEKVSGRVDYAITRKEGFMCIVEGKHRNIKIGYLQNIKQLESVYYMNKKKRTVDQAFGNNYYDYLYGIVSTAEEWHFIIYTSEGLYSTNNNEYLINLSKTAVKENPDVLRNNVKRIIGIIVGLLKDRVSVDNSSARKRVRIKKIIKKK